MLRRNFLKYTSVVVAMALYPNTLQASTDTAPLWIFIQASGGWDPTSFCDPKGYLEKDLDSNLNPTSAAMNRSFANADIATSTSAPAIKYAPIRGRDDNNVDYEFSTFFDRYGSELLVVNGIDTQTNGHDSGRRYMMSGKLSEGYPALSALIAGISMPASPLAFITGGGYDETFGVVAGTRLNNMRAINELAFVNRYDDTRNYFHQNDFERLQAANAARTQRTISNQNLESIKKLAQQYGLAHSGSNELEKLVEFLPDDINTHPDRNNTVFSQGRFAMAGYKAGLTASVNINISGFDTHGNHDASHIPRLARLLKGVDLLKQEALNQGISDNVIFVMGSEFGRTPGYNGGNGKDHWSVSSMMFMGKGIRGGRVIGSSTHGHDAQKINATTLVEDESGIYITYAHINKAMRKFAQIQNDNLITQYYPLSGTIEELNIFS
ncbi:DUF1501 domain-containing protein [Sulfurimonas sp. SAG-AH-194-L11]|nr:DUF1501 domain-containing protein [Sulfurimonas sp. SAG-AH-194-L11]MDF1877727.1 DUF1501 domain-containing protein [Sulfurimonas sp. SAG-AH-194-L11]